MGKRKKGEPKAQQVASTLASIGQAASRQVQQDYRGELPQKELRLLTAVYVRRVHNLLVDPDVLWVISEEGELCLTKG